MLISYESKLSAKMISKSSNSRSFGQRYKSSKFRLGNTLPVAFFSYLLGKAFTYGEAKLLSFAISEKGIVYSSLVFTGAVVSWTWSDLRGKDSLIKHIVNRLRNGVDLSLNVGLAPDQTGVRDGYQRVYIYQSITSCRSGRCEARYNTKAFFRKSPLFKEDGKAYFLGHKVDEFIIRDSINCIDGQDCAETKLVELLLPEKITDEVYYRLRNCEKFGDEYQVFPKNEFLSLSVRCTGPKKVFTTSKEEALTIHFNKDTSSLIELIGGAGDYECRACGTGKIRARHLDSYVGQGIINFTSSKK